MCEVSRASTPFGRTILVGVSMPGGIERAPTFGREILRRLITRTISIKQEW